ncbi:MAG: hypothetical protein KDK99_04900 [Verrucomicrobiales bacterium]|nr:hypothetical protein [Verrucomicrobiales bacterium]
MRSPLLILVVGLFPMALPLPAQQPSKPTDTALERRQWTIEGTAREALVHVPSTATTQPSPLIFGFHGHGGSMGNAARSYHLHTLWPEAIVVYPQGLNTPGRLTDPDGKKPGWLSDPSDPNNRDLKLFDAMLASLKAEYQIDDRRIYSTGHSNGGGFTYLLWAARPEVFAAMAPSASAASRSLPLLKPKPVLHIAGEADPLVKFAWQKATIDQLIQLNQCADSTAWELDANLSYYPSAIGCPVVTAIHPGTHKYPSQAPEVIVKFFKSQARPEK